MRPENERVDGVYFVILAVRKLIIMKREKNAKGEGCTEGWWLWVVKIRQRKVLEWILA